MRQLPRRPEPEVMADDAEAIAYACADFAQVNQAFVDRLCQLAAGIDSAQAIDLGTGPADIVLRVARALPRWHIVALDASPAMLRLARQAISACPEPAAFTSRVEFVLADAKNTGLPAHSFDVIFSNSILHHITETGRFWAEVKRLAKPGSLLFVRDLARPADERAARRIVEQYADGESDMLREEYYRSLLSAYTPDEIRSQLRAAGLDGMDVAMATDRHVDVFGRVP